MPASVLPVSEGQEPEPADARSLTSSTYERLLSEAAALFRKRGYEGTSTRALADSLGIQKASLYHHISNKEQLLYEMSMRSMDRMDARIREEVDVQTDPVERLGALIESHVTAMLEQPDPYAASLLELRSLTGEHARQLVQRRRDYEETLGKMVQDAQEAGAVRTDIPPKLLALLVLGTLNWPLFWYRPEGPVPPREVAAMVRAVTLGGVVATAAER